MSQSPNTAGESPEDVKWSLLVEETAAANTAAIDNTIDPDTGRTPEQDRILKIVQEGKRLNSLIFPKKSKQFQNYQDKDTRIKQIFEMQKLLHSKQCFDSKYFHELEDELQALIN